MAGHIVDLYNLEADGKETRFSFWGATAETDTLLRVRVEPATGVFANDPNNVWDTVYINDKNCGNRRGAMHEMVKIYSKGLYV